MTDQTKELVGVLYDTALLSSGYDLSEPTELSRRVVKMISKALEVENEAIEEIEEPEEPEEHDNEENIETASFEAEFEQDPAHEDL